MYAPFVEDSDDQLSQIAQFQVFLTLLSSLALRALPPSVLVGNMVTVILFAVPAMALFLQSPWPGDVSKVMAMRFTALKQRFPGLKPPPLALKSAEISSETVSDEQPRSILADALGDAPRLNESPGSRDGNTSSVSRVRIHPEHVNETRTRTNPGDEGDKPEVTVLQETELSG